MLNIKNIALICAILFFTTIQGISVEDDNSKNEAGSILQLRNRSLNSQLPHTPGHELDAFWQNILVTVLKTKEEFLTFSLTCKQFYKVMHNISKFHRLLFLGRINAEAIAPDMQDNPTFQPNLFSLYFNLLKEDGSPNFTAIDCFETQKGPLLKIWLLHRFSGVFDGAYHEMEQEIDRHSDALSYRMAPSGIWSFDQTVNKLIPPNIANLLSCERLI